MFIKRGLRIMPTIVLGALKNNGFLINFKNHYA